MPTTQAQTQQPAWTNAIADNIQEFSLTPLSVISGAIPAVLRGTLYRNGPGRLQLGGEKAGHWFDGDGAILAVHFTDSTPQATYRFVKTAAFVEESAAGEYLYTNYGIRKPDLIWNYWYKAFTNDLPIKNSANTSVLALDDRLLALCEAGKPHALDLCNLTTFGEDDLGGLNPGQAYIAHPKRDPETGHIYSIGVTQDIPNGNIHLDFVRHEDFPHTNEYLRELAFGDTHTRDSSTLWRLTLDPKIAQVKTLEQVMDRDCEFPVVPPHQVGQPWQHTYLAVHQPGTNITREGRFPLRDTRFDPPTHLTSPP
jgi:carotenoid cleavage dioxygenase-like enzyme